MPKPVHGPHFKDKNGGSLGWVLLAVVPLAQAQRASSPVLRSFDRVLLLGEKGETSAGVSVGDRNGDGLPDLVLGKGHHWAPLFNRVLMNDGMAASSPLTWGWPRTGPIRQLWPMKMAMATWTSWSATTRPIANLSTGMMAGATSLKSARSAMPSGARKRFR